jgi:hypothetical protein
VERDKLETIILGDIVSIVDELRMVNGVVEIRARWGRANKNLFRTFFLAVTRPQRLPTLSRNGHSLGGEQFYEYENMNDRH